jgi:hypothetical protein
VFHCSAGQKTIKGRAMSKKNKRQVQKTTASPAPVVSNSAAEITPARSIDRDFNPDYSYVKKDLKRIAILAGTFLAILIALSFILQ